MKIERHVVARKNQFLVALPAEVRDHLSLVPAAKVYWHVGRKGQVILTVSGRSRGGRPAKDEDCLACKRYRDELDRLRRELRVSRGGTPREWWRQGYARANSDLGNVKAEVQMCVRILQQLLRERRYAQGPRRDFGGREVRPGPDHYPPPPPPRPSPSASGGADTSGGEAPQVSQPEFSRQAP